METLGRHRNEDMVVVDAYKSPARPDDRPETPKYSLVITKPGEHPEVKRYESAGRMLMDQAREMQAIGGQWREIE